MESFAALLGIAAVLFAWTNVDDLFVLLGFFSDGAVRARHVVVGQYLGIGVLYGVSVLASLLSIVVPRAYIGLLGFAPIIIGITKLRALRRDGSMGERGLTGEGGPDRHAASSAGAGRSILAVATVTVANGGDNIGVFVPLLATRSAWDIAAVGLVFALMTGIWCLFGHWLVHHPALGIPIRRHGHRTLPFLLIGFGILILYAAGTLSLL
jgi:cadmium resistance protein CadD (predicted permease)